MLTLKRVQISKMVESGNLDKIKKIETRLKVSMNCQRNSNQGFCKNFQIKSDFNLIFTFCSTRNEKQPLRNDHKVVGKRV